MADGDDPIVACLGKASADGAELVEAPGSEGEMIGHHEDVLGDRLTGDEDDLVVFARILRDERHLAVITDLGTVGDLEAEYVAVERHHEIEIAH